MKTFIFCIGIILFLSLSIFAQIELPKIGTIGEIQSFTKVYVATDSTDARKLILKALKKQKNLKVVNDAKDAEFLLEYKGLSRQGTFGSRNGYEERGEMTAYYFKEKQKIIVWSETERYSQASGISFEKPNETVLTQKFLKAFSAK